MPANSDPAHSSADRRRLAEWVKAYEHAWRAPGTEAVADLFTADATYSTAPFEEPHRGIEAIRAMWDRERGPGEAFTIESEIVAVEAATGVVRCEVHYEQPLRQSYRDLWVVRLDGEGRCTSFEEWPFWPPGSHGTVASGSEEAGRG